MAGYSRWWIEKITTHDFESDIVCIGKNNYAWFKKMKWSIEQSCIIFEKIHNPVKNKKKLESYTKNWW